MNNAADRDSSDNLLKMRDEIRKELRKREEKEMIFDIPARAVTAEVISPEGPSSEEMIEKLNSVDKVIYGVDDRREIYTVTDQAVKDNASGVISLIRDSNILDNGNGTSTIRARTYGVVVNLCSNERFYNEPISPFCTGFLVGSNIVATAAHCVQDINDLQTIKFVFGFRIQDDTMNAQLVIDNNEIYQGIDIIRRIFTNDGSDWALIKLDRSVNGNHKIIKIRRSGKINDNQSIYVIGHPAGLPMKFADGANVRDNSNSSFFISNLDTYGGNSGSPVFNRDTHEAEGILVRGEQDYFFTRTRCRRSTICPSTGCRGEDCTRTTEFGNLIL